jgi:tetratricopeptide (TPR) repeat protein
VKPMTTARQALLATVLASTTLVSTGCSSGGFTLASMNPFSKPTPLAGTDSKPGKGLTESIASTTSTVGQTAKTALGKTTSAVAAVFKRNKDADNGASTDPLSLTSGPKKVGPEVFVANGQLWESTGDHGKAMESYIKALESEPDHVPALTSIARLHFREGKHQQAAEFFSRAIELSPEDAGLHNDLGLTLSKLNDHEGSIISLERALQLAPGTSRYANNLASLKFEAGDVARAFQVLSENNKPAVAHFNMAYLHFKNGQTTQAKKHLTEVLHTNPSDATDPAIQRAIERSRDMLVQIDGPASSTEAIAQATPEAIIADRRFMEQKQRSAMQGLPVQQISQSSEKVAVTLPLPKATPTPSSTLPATMPTAPPQLPSAVSAITASLPAAASTAKSQWPTAASAIAPPPPTEVPVAASAPKSTSISEIAPVAQPTAVSAITLPPPRESLAAEPAVERPRPIKPLAPDADAKMPSVPFSLPASFKANETK